MRFFSTQLWTALQDTCSLFSVSIQLLSVGSHDVGHEQMRETGPEEDITLLFLEKVEHLWRNMYAGTSRAWCLFDDSVFFEIV